MADFKFKYCSYAVRVAASVARRRDPSSHKATTGQGGLGNFYPRVALVEQISSLLSPEKAAEGETLRHMSRTTTTHAYHLPVQNPACAGARGAGGGVSTPAKTHKFCAQPTTHFLQNSSARFCNAAKSSLPLPKAGIVSV